MSSTHPIRDAVMAEKSESDQRLIHTIAEQLDSIRNNRFGLNDPVEDWLYDAANVVVMTVREWDAEAMGREPLEDVLRDTKSWLQYLDMELRDDGQFSCAVYGYEVIGADVPVMVATRYGADPVEAIRNAVAAAKREKA